MGIICDAEFDSLNPTRLWCAVTKDIDTGEVRVFRYDKEGDFQRLPEYANSVDRIFGHNFLSFDNIHLARLVPSWRVAERNIRDTLIVSRLVNYTRSGGHSLESIGAMVGVKKKPIIEYDRPDLIEEYVERCVSDVEINYLYYTKHLKRFFDDPEWQQSIDNEHDLQVICNEITTNGFEFNKPLAESLLEEITCYKDKLTNEIRRSVGPVREKEKDVVLRRKKDGTPDSRSMVYVNSGLCSNNFGHGDVLEIFTEREFNPGSPKDRINLLNEAGWKPTVKTKTHLDAERTYRQKQRKKKLTAEDQERWDRLKLTGWVVNETNLNTLPEDAPRGAHKLAEWLTLEGRRADLEEWLGQYRADTGSIHSNVNHIGSWTHRCSHNNPNCANIFSTWEGEPKTAVERVKAAYDTILRSLWYVSDPNEVLIGCDAEGIQLRILAHYMEDEEYINAVESGDKKKGTDAHTLNMKALGLPHLTRDHAKTFIYAWLLGAGYAKIAEILQCSMQEAKVAVENFLRRFPGLERLKKEIIPAIAKKGFFIGLDGRKVLVPNEHKVLAGMLQNGEKVIMLTANKIWRKEADERHIHYKQLNFVHDEWQTRTTRNYGRSLGCIQADSFAKAGTLLGLRCRLAGEFKIGRNWAETH